MKEMKNQTTRREGPLLLKFCYCNIPDNIFYPYNHFSFFWPYFYSITISTVFNFFFVEKKQKKNIYLALFRLTSVNMQNKVNKRHMENFFQGVLRTKQCDLKSIFFRQIIQAQLIHTRRMFRRPGSNTDRTVLRRAILRTILCFVHKLQFILR